MKGHIVKYCDKMKRDRDFSNKNNTEAGRDLSRKLDRFRVYQEGNDDLDDYIRNLSSN